MGTDSIRPYVGWLLPLGLLVSLGGLVVLLAASTRLPEADFTLNNGTEVTTLDPATVTGVPEGRMIRALFEGLVIKHPVTLEPVPGMAEAWDISPDGLVYTFHIRRGARWSNGDPFTAHDFVYSLERFLNPATAAEYAYQLWYVKGARAYTRELDADGRPLHTFDSVAIRALDDHTLQIELVDPTPYFMQLMGFYPLFPVNRRNIEEAKRAHPDSWQLEWLRPENIVTNGPYKVAFRRVNDRIRLVKNPEYWDAENVAFETVDVLAVDHWGTGLNYYLTGTCHWCDHVPATVIPRLLGREDFQPRQYLGIYFLRVNTTRPPLDDPRVRKALSLTLNRADLCAKVTKAGQVPAYDFVPPGIPEYDRIAGADADPEDPARARALLAEAGYGPGGKPFPSIEVHYNTSETHRDVAEVVASTWQRELGIPVKLLNQEWKVYLDTQSNLAYDVSRSSWIADYADPNTFLDLFLSDGENNKTGWGDPEYDRLIKAAAGVIDVERRYRLLRRAESILLEQLPVLPIYYYVTQDIVAPRLGGFHHNPLDEHFPKYFYWMDDEELAARRAAQPPGLRRVERDPPFPEGLYSPSALGAKERAR